MCPDHQGHLVMPAAPGPYFIVAHPQQLLAGLEAGFNRPTHPAHAHQRGQRRVRRRIAQIGLQLARFRVPAQHQPDRRAKVAVADGLHPLHYDIGNKRTFPAIFDRVPFPGNGRRRICQGTHGDAIRGSVVRTDVRVVRHFRDVPHPQLRHGIQEGGIAPKGLICRQPAAAQGAGHDHRPDHRQSQCEFRLERHLGGRTTCLAALHIRRILHPGLGQVQAAVALASRA